jgi:hypothetical protein
MQTETFSGTRASWPQWAEFLRRHRLESLAAWALEALGPLTLISAQVLHFGSPLVRPAFGSAHVESFASLLEDPGETRDFAAFLREDISL